MIDLSTGKQMTRRDAVKGLAGLAGIIAAGQAPAAVVRSMLGARGVAMTESEWVNPYVTDGLVAMWDGEWNAGPGVHDGSVNHCIDLSGSEMKLALFSGQIFDNYFRLVEKNENVFTRSINFYGCTIEIVAYDPNNRGQDQFGKWFYIGSVSLIQIRGNAIGTFYTTHQLIYPKSSLSFVCNGTTQVSKRNLGGTKQINFTFETGAKTISIKNGWYAPNIYTVRIYNRAISTLEAAKNYAIDKARFGLP